LPALSTVAVGLWAAAAQVAILLLVFLILFAVESRWNRAQVGASAH
jgi:uncharacterized membrane protein